MSNSITAQNTNPTNILLMEKKYVGYLQEQVEKMSLILQRTRQLEKGIETKNLKRLREQGLRQIAKYKTVFSRAEGYCLFLKRLQPNNAQYQRTPIELIKRIQLTVVKTLPTLMREIGITTPFEQIQSLRQVSPNLYCLTSLKTDTQTHGLHHLLTAAQALDSAEILLNLNTSHGI
jgi:hypothetical protein